MTLDEAKELFPEVPKEPPEGASGYIYVTFEPISGKFYLGKKTRKRWKESYYGGGRYPKQWQKDGLCLEHWPIQWCFSMNELNEAEHTWIDKFKYHIDIKNMIEGGVTAGAKIIAEEFRQRHIESSIGENNNFYGKSHTEETKTLISNKLKDYYSTHDNYWKGKHMTEDTKEKLRQRALERNLDPEFRKNTSKKLREFYQSHDAKFLGCQHTEDTKEQMSKRKVELYNKERIDYIPNNDKLCGCMQNRIKVICLDTGEIFNSIQDANRAYGVTKSHLSDVCKGKRRTAFGKHWAFYEENSEPSSLPNYSYSNELGFLERKTCLA